MNYHELLKNRRSIRKFKENEVSLDLIQSLINESIFAPSAGNAQPWEFIIINNREFIDQLSAECKQTMLDRIAKQSNDYAKKYEKMLQNPAFHIFYKAPAVVLIVGSAKLKNIYVDCALAASYFMLAATNKGLGSCWINFATEINHAEMRQQLGLNAEHAIIAPIALGYPEKIPSIPKRKEAKIIKTIQ